MYPSQYIVNCFNCFHEQDVISPSPTFHALLVWPSQDPTLTPFYSVFSDAQLCKCQIFVAAWHFTATSAVLYIATLPPFRAFKSVRVPITQMLPISVFFVGF